ncbi:unnamed protein product [Urochloa humidicola]
MAALAGTLAPALPLLLPPRPLPHPRLLVPLSTSFSLRPRAPRLTVARAASGGDSGPPAEAEGEKERKGPSLPALSEIRWGGGGGGGCCPRSPPTPRRSCSRACSPGPAPRCCCSSCSSPPRSSPPPSSTPSSPRSSSSPSSRSSISAFRPDNLYFGLALKQRWH